MRSPSRPSGARPRTSVFPAIQKPPTMLRGIDPSTNKDQMNPSPNWMLAQVVFLLAACQRHPNDLPRDGGREAEALSSSTSTLARGNIGGHAKLRGVVPAPRVVRLPSELDRSCGRSASDQTLRVASQGSLADVVVFLEDESALSNEKSAADLLPTVVDQRGCVFWPPVSVAPTDGALELVNSDPLLHNVRANVGSEGLFNFAMPIQGLRSRKRLPSRPG